MAQIVSEPSDPGGYITGEKIIVIVETEKPLSVEGSPRLEIEIGDRDRLADFRPTAEDDWLPDQPSRRWRFEYTVAGDDLDLDGISISALALVDQASFLVEGLPVWVILTAIVSGDASGDHVQVEPGENLSSHRMTRPREPRICADERELAVNFSALAREWDGAAFRVDMVRNFPASVTEADAWQVLDLLGLLAEKIEGQLGYPILEKGGLIRVPARASPDWDVVRPETWATCPLLRDQGQILLYHRIGIVNASWVEAFAFDSVEAVPRCGAIAVNLVDLRHWNRDAEIARALFYFLGFQDPWAAVEREQGVRMSDPLFHAWRPGLESVLWSDIDALRCIFPEGG